MKKHSIFFASILLMNTWLFAQNIGIGDPLPSAKLTIAGSETTPNGQAASLKIINTAATNAWYLRAGATGTNTPANGFSIGDNANIHFNLLSNGNIGLGILPQSARLHVNGPIKIEGTNLFEFGAGIAGKELNAGKIGYNGFGTNALAIVGAGTNTTDRKVYFFAEGGTHFSGPVSISQDLNMGGQLELNGNTGVAGQVITSNGASAPTWQNQPFSNNTRFGFNFLTNSVGAFVYNTIYNINPTDITNSGATITINKSGLYHFEGFIEMTVIFSTAEPTYLAQSTYLTADGERYDISNVEPLIFISISPEWVYRKTLRYTNEIYISAPATVTVGRNILISAGSPPTISSTGKLSGYLISE